MSQSNKKSRRDPASYHLFLGVDGGGTKTGLTIINSEGIVLGEAIGGPSNPLRVGVETAVSNIAKALDRVCDEFKLYRGDIEAATLGLAGGRRQDIRDRVSERFISRSGIRPTTVTTDADIALYATTLGGAGVVVIAGTGSVCLGVNGKGEKAMSGGWGPIAGDEGSGRAIAGEALKRVARAADGRSGPTALSDRAAEYFRASSPEDLIGALYAPGMDNSRIAGFARFVIEAAVEGDAVAIETVQGAGRELGIATSAVIRKLGLSEMALPIGCVGSVFNAGELLTLPMAAIIKEIAPEARLIKPILQPSHAAARIAKEGLQGSSTII